MTKGKNICLNNKARKEKIGPIIPWTEEQKGNISVERMNQQKKQVKKKNEIKGVNGNGQRKRAFCCSLDMGLSILSLSLFPLTLRPHFSRHNNSLSISECTNCISDIFQQETEDEKVKLHIKLSWVAHVIHDTYYVQHATWSITY